MTTPRTPRRRPPEAARQPAAGRSGASAGNAGQNRTGGQVRPPTKKGPPAAKGQARDTAAPVGRWLPAMAAMTVLAIVVAAGAVGGDDKRGIAGADVPETSVVVDPTSTLGAATLGAATTTTLPSEAIANGVSYEETGLTVPASTMPGVGESGATIVKTHLSTSLYQGSYSEEVKAVQTRLTELGFVPGGTDGSFGEMTKEAVWAYEKLILQTPYDKATGKVTDEMWQTMQDPIVIQPRRPGSGTHVEIYLPQQVAAVFTDNLPAMVLHISSGTAKTSERTLENSWCEQVRVDTSADGELLEEPEVKDVCGVSFTPGGVFRFQRQVTGDRVGALGRMFNPIYFNYGIAMHGAKNVPLEPASHGCIRMNQTISNTFQAFVHLRDRVYVWGWDGKEPEQYTKRETYPVFNYPDPTATTTTTTTPKPTTTTAKPTATTEKVTPTTKPAATTTTEKPAPTTSTSPPTTPPPTTAPPTTAAPATTAAPVTTAAPSAVPPSSSTP